MEYYYKNSKGHLVPTTLKDMLQKAVEDGGIETDSGAFIEEGHHWVGIVQRYEESKKPKVVTTNISFKKDENTIDDIRIFVTPIKIIEDEENTKQIR